MTMLRGGRQIGSFVLLDRIGQTNMGEVWRAQDSARQIVAIKSTNPKFRGDAQFSERFVRERLEQRKLHHDAIVPSYDSFESDGIFYLMMAYIPGGSLDLEVTEALEISRQILGALDFAHRHAVTVNVGEMVHLKGILNLFGAHVIRRSEHLRAGGQRLFTDRQSDAKIREIRALSIQ